MTVFHLPVRASCVACATVAVLAFPASVRAETVTVSPTEDWAAVINSLSPGDVAELQAGRYTGGSTITVQGTPAEPITIRGFGQRESIFDGESGGRALRIYQCQDLILENVQITNPSPYGHHLDATQADFDYSGSARDSLAEGIQLTESQHVTVRDSRFFDVATRGILIGDSHDLTIEHNIFVRVGDDTASGDVAAGSGSSRHHIHENLFAGNVDGVVHHAAGTEHRIERNLFVFHPWENNIDLKFHSPKSGEDPWSIIIHNVIYAHRARYSGVELQDSTDNVRVHFNVIRGSETHALQIRGRSGPSPLENFEIIGNWFDATVGDGSVGDSGIYVRVQSQDPADVIGVWVLHNIFTDYAGTAVRFNHGEDLHLFNNIFTGGGPAASVSTVTAGTNLYDDTEPWSVDSSPIVGTPIYAESPVGLLADGSPGKGEATILTGHDWGPDVGLPSEAAGLAGLEVSILVELAQVFTIEEIEEAYAQGDLEVPELPDPDAGVPDGGPPPDAGTGGSGGTDDAGAPGATPSDTTSDEGCGCITAGATERHSSRALWLLLLAVWRRCNLPRPSPSARARKHRCGRRSAGVHR